MNSDSFTYDMKHLSFDCYFRIFSSWKTKNYIDNCNNYYYCTNMMAVNKILFIGHKLDENVVTKYIYILELIFEKIVVFALLARLLNLLVLFIDNTQMCNRLFLKEIDKIHSVVTNESNPYFVQSKWS